jgi:hypothetical protein
MNALPPRLHLLGSIANFVTQPAPTPIDVAMQVGLTFVAIDARAYPDFTGGRPLAEWVVSREVKIDPRLLEPWPQLGWCYQEQAAARAAYMAFRTHALQRLGGVEVRDDRGVLRRLNEPSTALGEAFSASGQEILYLSCDVATEATLVRSMTERLAPY